MSLFKLFQSQSFENDYKIFVKWANTIFTNTIPHDIQAFNFNLYEGADPTYHIQVIGTNNFNESDADWACTDYFTTGENICYIERRNVIKEWQKGLEYITKIILRYLNENNLYDKYSNLVAVGTGFVDGDIEVISRRI